MRKMFRVTYDIVTPESAEHGDTAENGFVYAGLGAFPLEQCDLPPEMTLRDALQLASPQEDSGSWFSEADGRDDYVTGANETRSIHPPANITAASYGRLRRLFGIRH